MAIYTRGQKTAPAWLSWSCISPHNALFVGGDAHEQKRRSSRDGPDATLDDVKYELRVKVYPDATHADAEATKDAIVQVRDFLARYLGPAQ